MNQSLEIRFPFDRSVVVGSVTLCGPADVEAAIAGAAAAFQKSRSRPAHERAAVLTAAARAIAAKRDHLAQIVCLEAGKPITLARAEIDRAASTFSFAADEARRTGGELLPLDAAPTGTGRLGLTIRVPRGPVAAITPFNFPVNLAAHKIAPALAVGAPIIHKPALETPLSAVALRETLLEAGVEADALAVVTCANEAATALIEDPRLPVLSFTGSASVGWALKARAPRKQVTLELGGNAAVVIEPDADYRAHLPRLVSAAFAYAGQVCIKAQRFLVHEKIADEFTQAFTAAVRTQAIAGDPRRPEVLVGPLIRSRDADRIMQWIDEARSAGARVLCGGGRDGDIVEATLLEGVPPSCRLSCEEAFGPVSVIERYKTFDEALARVNASRYGLQTGVFTNDVGRVFRALRELDVGAVIHNDAPTFRVDHMPYGGVKDSGWGREGLRYAIEDMTEPRLLVLRV